MTHSVAHHPVVRIVAAMFLVFAAMPAFAERISYNNQGELVGAAASAPESARQVLQGIVAHCAQFGPEPRSALASAYAEWEQRHQRYLVESAVVKKQLFAGMNQPGLTAAQRKGWKDLEEIYNVGLPKLIKASVAQYSTAVDVLPNARLKASMCIDYAQSIKDGKWDLKTNNPTVAQFLDDHRAGKGQ